MIRLLDRVLKYEGQDNADDIDFERLRAAYPVLIDNVAEYYYQNHDYEKDLEFPCARPPFPTTWIEYLLKGKWLAGASHSAHYGLLMSDISDVVTDVARVNVLKDDQVLACWLQRAHEAGATSYFKGTGFRGEPDRAEVCVLSHHMMAFKENGEPFRESINITGADFTGDVTKFTILTSSLLIRPAYLALAFMHCKNVTLQQSQKVRVKTRRSPEAAPEVRFHTISIEPIKRVLSQEGRVESDGLAKALHICRGHFKDYSEKGLFGREDLKGRFWWPMHARGTSSKGIIVQQYDVKP